MCENFILIDKMADDTLEVQSCVRGYHVYSSIWPAVVGEELQCIRESTNVHDRYSVGVVKDGNIVGHLPRKISHLCSLFIRRGGTILCRIRGTQQYSRDLPQGGLEIPCTLLFNGSSNELKKLWRLTQQ